MTIHSDCCTAQLNESSHWIITTMETRARAAAVGTINPAGADVLVVNYWGMKTFIKCLKRVDQRFLFCN